ncbi:MAG TPA: RhuM family protein [Bacteroidales bacterium]|nr:RhuM family protein [Bacteroidales bacterium]HQL69823.1 RhuM family protein [Bacteroidales bacterium]
MTNEIIVYQDNEQSVKLEVRIEEETVWLTQNQIVELFNSSKANISEHIKNIFETTELDEFSTVRKIRTVQIEGSRKVSRELVHYNLDMIISIGYRVNSIRGTQFRKWANKVLKEYMLKGYAVNNRIDRLESDVHVQKKRKRKYLILLSS